MFTNRPKKEVLKYFKNFSIPDFAKAGAVPNEDFVLEPQPLPQFQVKTTITIIIMIITILITIGTYNNNNINNNTILTLKTVNY